MLHILKKQKLKYKSFTIFSKKILKKLQQLSTSRNIKLEKVKDKFKKKIKKNKIKEMYKKRKGLFYKIKQ